MSESSTPRDLSRRGFISDLAIGAGGALAISNLAPAEAAAAQIAAKEVGIAEWDLTWIDRLTGKYRAVFDSPDINEGTVFTNAQVFLMGFSEVYKASDADMQPVLVLRHHGVHLAFNDAMWEKYAVAESLKLPVGDKKNPYTSQISALRDRGAMFLVCNLAANRQAGTIARRIGADVATVRADIYANFIPGAILQHSGVFATIRAQQAGCSFMKSA